MIYIVEILAVYELPGVTPTAARINARNNDEAAAANAADKYEPNGVAPEDEYLMDADAHYGFGWRCRQFVSVKQTATSLGTAVFTRLSSRNLKDGSKILVFPDLRDEGQQNTTGDPVYARYWPRANPPSPDIG